MAKRVAVHTVEATPQRWIEKIETSVSGTKINIVVLCNDKTAWRYNYDMDTWVKLAPIPQL